MAVGRNIKGITVEIGGDTTKLTQALSKVNGEIRNTQAQLKDVNKLLKLDPGNTELIAQKHKLLAQPLWDSYLSQTFTSCIMPKPFERKLLTTITGGVKLPRGSKQLFTVFVS